jgi:hypothetical protein
MGVLLRWLLFFPDFGLREALSVTLHLLLLDFGLREALSVTFTPSFAGFRA